MVDEQKQIERARRGDEHAMAKLLQTHYSFLMKYLVKMTMNPVLAEDLAQETMLRCIEKIHLYNEKSKFSSWLITLATRIYIDQMRRNRTEKNWRDQERAFRLTEWQLKHQKEAWTDAVQALSRLDYEWRLPILLKHYYGYTYDEIADMMDIPPGTVKSRIHNGLQQLRKELTTDETK
ncbi:RNA polymerase sigma factor SigY [Paenibacillus azoreducens]|uniref:RNA polymerase sigma factor SigY n=1 Tax=Paenibacillus azoreducens TaxID=116718 RepID=A0A920CMS2_9BACL|nr:RNA polymerase sigma factor SigY [Paenibacillus azoreducens]GIO46646.1 RNA polymerase sigma factor SigY [Paenibacillus azoreducens]